MIGGMRAPILAAFAAIAIWVAVTAAQTPLPATFRLSFLGHEIGREADTLTSSASGTQLQAVFHFDDRGTAVDLTATLDQAADGTPRHFLIKGRNYRLFTSDAEVTVTGARAHVRDLQRESDLAIGGKPFFPIDNYAPIGVQEALIKYWRAHGEPAEINSAPAGPIRIAKAKRPTMVQSFSGSMLPDGRHAPNVVRTYDRLSIDGAVWGREMALVDQAGNLAALTTWAGALPFEAVRVDSGLSAIEAIDSAVADRIDDLKTLTSEVPIPLRERDGFALIGARVIEGTDRPPIENATIVVEAGRITAIGSSSTTHPRAETLVIDVKGKTIIAGLWDMHAHASQVDWAPVYLASGVTTIRDMGGEQTFLTAIRDAIASGKAFGPRYLLAGLVDGPGPQAFGAVTAATPEEGIAVVHRYHDQHFDQIKIYDYVVPEVVSAITAEAHKLGMTVTGHVPHGMTAQSVVEAGFDNIAHMQLRGASGSDQSKAQIAFFKAHGTVMDPTQSWNELSGRPAEVPLADLFPDIERLPRSLARMFDSMPLRSADVAAYRARQLEPLKLLRDAVNAGVPVVAGTDKGVPGFSLQRELELYVEGGMTPLQALQSATIVPARVMKLDGDVGTVEVGKRADLVILEGNPLDKIANIRTAVQVVVNGKLYDCDALWRAAGFQPRKH